MGWIGGFARLTRAPKAAGRLALWAHTNNTINIDGNLHVDPRENTAARQGGQQPPRTEDTADSTDGDHR